MNIIYKWFKRISLGALLLISLSLIIGYVFEKTSRANAEKIKPSGSFVDINSHRLHYLKKGSGGPTVIFETAFDPTGHLQWYNIQQKLPKSFTSISYDRSGILWSERGQNSKSGKNIAQELHLLLEQINAPKPYILVGHSFGAMLTKFFVNEYPHDIAGVILVDSQCPNDQDYLSPELYEMVNQVMPDKLLRFANTFGATRIMFKDMFPDKVEYKYQKSIMPNLLYKSADAILEEQDAMNSIKIDAAKINSFGSIPLYVLSAVDKNRFDNVIKDDKLKKEMVEAWSNMQKDLLNLSPINKHILVPNSSHYINEDQPDVLIETINNMINQYRNKELIN